MGAYNKLVLFVELKLGILGSSGILGILGMLGISGIFGMLGMLGISGILGMLGISGIFGMLGISGIFGMLGTVGIVNPSMDTAFKVKSTHYYTVHTGLLVFMVRTGEDQLNSPNRTSRVHPTTLRILVILISEYSSQMVVQLVSLVIPCELADETL